MEYSQDDSVLVLDFVHRDKREQRKNELPGAVDTPNVPAIRQGAESAECARTLTSFGLTERQAPFLVTVIGNRADRRHIDE